MRKSLLTLGLGLLTTLTAMAQYRCGTDLMNNRERSRNPFLVQAQDNYERLMREEMIEWRNNRDGEPEAVLVIPMVFHILHLDGPENISDEQIYDQIEILNRDYNKLNADTIVVVSGFDTIVANVKLEFRLATKDFLGNCTNGIERIRTIETYVGDNGSKLNQWPRERYVNVWTVANMENGVAGYSQYPSSVIDGQSALADGVIIRHNYIGSIGTGSDFASRALTHEIGHFLDLAHPWGSTNEPEVECGDDGVADTPVTEGHDDCNDLRDFSCSSTAMTNAIYDFNGVFGGTGGTTDPTTPPMLLLGEEDFTRLQFTQFQASGVAINPNMDGEFAFTGWGEGAVQGATSYSEMSGSINTAKYYEFTVTPRPGSAMTLTELKFRAGRAASGPRAFAVRSSLNNFANNIVASVAPANPNLVILTNPNPTNTFFFAADTAIAVNGAKVTLGGTTFSALTSPVTFRIYAFNAEDAAGAFSIDNVELVGTYGVIENVQNFMDYSYCSHMFTNGQKERMRLALNAGISGRSNLWTDANRALTGTDDNPLVCAPVADFYPATKFACVDEDIEFVDNSTNGVVDSYSWTFQDGNPATSTDRNPSVSFNSEGRKTVTLTVTNAMGSTTKTMEQCVVIAPVWTETGGPLFQDNFDSAVNFHNHYVPANYDSNISVWNQTNMAGFSNNTSAYLNAYAMSASNIDEGGYDIDELVTPSCNLDLVAGAAVSFKYAYATQSTDLAGITDVFEVYISNDCGQTWSSLPRISLEGLDLVTAGSVSIPFFPSSSADWREESFTIPNTYLTEGFRMKFYFRAGEFPNNLFIDDINMTGTVGLNEQDADFFGAMVYPNPANESTVLTYVDRGAANLNITLTDLSGRAIETWTPRASAPGAQRIEIDTRDLATGAYLISLHSNGHSRTLKLMVD
jgi:PKD repeat protein